jgi:hypothetical protein
VPDLSNPKVATSLWEPRAGGGSFANAEYNGSTVLTVTGVLSTTVKSTPTITSPATTNAEILTLIKNLSISRQDQKYVGGGTIWDAFVRALVMNLFCDRFLPQNLFYAYLAQARKHLDQAFDEDRTAIPRALHLYLDCVKFWSQHRNFFTSDEGYMWWVPAGAKQGGKICVPLGSGSPFVLRPYKDNQWLVMGECFAYRLMEPQAFLGPLPENYICVDLFDNAVGRISLSFSQSTHRPCHY